MEQIPSLEANLYSASQKNPSLLLWNPKVHYHVHIDHCHLSLFWARWIQSTLSYPISIRSILMLSSHLSMPRSSKLSFPFRFSGQNFICLSHSSHTFYMLCPSHSPSFDHPNNTWWSMLIMKPLLMQSSSSSSHFLLFRSSYSSQHSVVKTLIIYVLSLAWETKFYTHTK